ncbi:MAG: hypothetical protein IH576_03835 [Deltaproteobacteria bacterium]|nr:hypothetical protein [Deltaproteobacteria bacterium]
MKSKETDSLRSALASLNRENTKLAEQSAALSKQVAAGKETEAALSAQVKELDESLKRLGEGLTGTRRKFDTGRIPREQLIDELLEGERATGRRMQELSVRADECEKKLERTDRENAAREQEIEELKTRLSILSGRVERIREEGVHETRYRDERFALLSYNLEEVSPEIGVTPVGPALRIVVPEKLLVGERDGKLTKTGAVIVSRLSGAVSELPSASLLIITGGKTAGDTFRAAASADGKIPPERLMSHVREQGRTAEFLLIVR